MAGARSAWLVLAALLLVTLVAYQPAWRGAPVWDDDAHLTRADLRSVEGLRRIWFEPGATQQYYPLLHSTFWLARRAWGGQVLGYHLLSICLHALSAFLFWLALRRLAVPWPWLAAFLFALHPVHVESVAWMSELKNTLSGALFMGSALAYLRFDATRRRTAYVAAFGLFVLALLSKTVTATFPALALVVIWWKRGRLDARRDLLPLAPFALAGAVSAAVTIWAEHTLIGARGAEFDLTGTGRVLVAGRAMWFYLGKLVWPANLTFIYPRWSVDAGTWWQYLPPAGIAVLAAGLWRWRGRSRAPLAALLFFGIALAPALGFIDVYPFRYSYVADHFQYLASLAVIALGAGGLARALARRGRTGVRVQAAVALALLGPLMFLTRAQSADYADPVTLYRATIARDPGSWMAHNNLAVLRLPGYVDEAMAHLDAALSANPAYPEAHNNRGLALQLKGRFAEAVAAHAEAVRLEPGFAEAHNNRGTALQKLGRLDEAAAAYAEALRLRPGNLQGLVNLGSVRMEQGRLDETIDLYRRALRVDPALADVRFDLAAALVRAGRIEAALAEYEVLSSADAGSADAHAGFGAMLMAHGYPAEAIRPFGVVAVLRPDSPKAHQDLGHALYRAGAFDRAERAYAAAVARAPDSGEAQNNLGAALERLGRYEEAAAHYGTAVRLLPESADARANLARAAGLAAQRRRPAPR